jgi:hypothetical protein
MLVCLLTELNIQLTGGPAVGGAVQVWAIKGMLKIKNPKAPAATRLRHFGRSALDTGLLRRHMVYRARKLRCD